MLQHQPGGEEVEAFVAVDQSVSGNEQEEPGLQQERRQYQPSGDAGHASSRGRVSRYAQSQNRSWPTSPAWPRPNSTSPSTDVRRLPPPSASPYRQYDRPRGST